MPIKTLKQELSGAKKNQGDWKVPYLKLMKAVYNSPVLFFALSKEYYDSKDSTSVPLISTKDFGGVPAIYVFTEIETATLWMQHYHAVSDDIKYGLIGAVKKENHNFLSIFPIASQMGTQMIMLDEGGSYVGIDLRIFLEENGIDNSQIEMPIDDKTAENLLNKNVDPQISFARVHAIPLTGSR